MMSAYRAVEVVGNFSNPVEVSWNYMTDNFSEFSITTWISFILHEVQNIVSQDRPRIKTVRELRWIGNARDIYTELSCLQSSMLRLFGAGKYQHPNIARFLTIHRLNYSNGPTGRTMTEGSSMSISGMGCWNTALVLDNIWERPISKLQTLIERHW